MNGNGTHGYVPMPTEYRLGPGWLIFVCGDHGWFGYGPFIYGPEDLDDAIEDLIHGINEDIVRLTDRDVVTITEVG